MILKEVNTLITLWIRVNKMNCVRSKPQ